MHHRAGAIARTEFRARPNEERERERERDGAHNPRGVLNAGDKSRSVTIAGSASGEPFDARSLARIRLNQREILRAFSTYFATEWKVLQPFTA